MQTLNDIGELEAIARLTTLLQSNRDITLGPGDDCAIISSPGQDLVLTSDPVIQDVHFVAGDAPATLGHKAVGRALSDLAAMGATPSGALINVVAPANTAIDLLEDVYRGADALAARHNLPIAGGDVAQGAALELHVFAIGHVPSGTAVRRSGAAQGDSIFVTGSLGGSRKGHHLSFEPRVAEGIWLREHEWPSAMIDISDGLATDLRHLLARSCVGARINSDRIPLSKDCLQMQDDLPPLQHALQDGEDFELLFTIPSDKTNAFEAAWHSQFPLACTRIGQTIDPADGVVLVDDAGATSALTATAFEHFKTSN